MIPAVRKALGKDMLDNRTYSTSDAILPIIGIPIIAKA